MNAYRVNREPYGIGELHQTCSECPWWQSGHGLEVQSCPLCGAPTAQRVAIEFGGAIVEFDGKHFTFRTPVGTAEIDEADYPDVIAFMSRHAIQAPLHRYAGAKRRIVSGVGDYHEKHPGVDKMGPDRVPSARRRAP